MFHYTMIQWLFFFYLYSFMGWCFESAYVSVSERKLTNRGFIRGPFLPIYGSGATMMLVVSMPFRDNLVLTYLAGCVGATILEYVTSVVMEALFQVRYWDYSHLRFQFQGRISLSSTLMWGVFTILASRVIQIQIEKPVLLIPSKVLTGVTLVLTALICADFALSFKAAVDLRTILVKMEKVKTRMVRIQKRLDGIMGSIAGGVNVAKNGLTQNVSELKRGIENRLERLKAIALARSDGAYSDDIREEVMDLKEEYAVSSDEHENLSELEDVFQRGLIRSNPGMTSAKYKEFLDELKSRVIGRWSGGRRTEDPEETEDPKDPEETEETEDPEGSEAGTEQKGMENNEEKSETVKEKGERDEKET